MSCRNQFAGCGIATDIWIVYEGMVSWSPWSPQRRVWCWDLLCVFTTHTDLGLLAIRQVSLLIPHNDPSEGPVLCIHSCQKKVLSTRQNKMHTKLLQCPLVHYCLDMAGNAVIVCVSSFKP